MYDWQPTNLVPHTRPRVNLNYLIIFFPTYYPWLIKLKLNLKFLTCIFFYTLCFFVLHTRGILYHKRCTHKNRLLSVDVKRLSLGWRGQKRERWQVCWKNTLRRIVVNPFERGGGKKKTRSRKQETGNVTGVGDFLGNATSVGDL